MLRTRERFHQPADPTQSRRSSTRIPVVVELNIVMARHLVVVQPLLGRLDLIAWGHTLSYGCPRLSVGRSVVAGAVVEAHGVVVEPKGYREPKDLGDASAVVELQ